MRILWTFGCGTAWKGKCVITNSTDFETAMNFVYDKYGQYNVGSSYTEPYHDISEHIKKYNYSLLEEVNL